MLTTATPIQILLIEDSYDDAVLIQTALRKQKLGNEVLHFTDGEAALDYLWSTGEYVGLKPKQTGLILLDLKLPKVPGLVILQRLRDNPKTRRIPVVVLTAAQDDKELTDAYLYGANSYVIKPLDFKSFSKAVGEIGLYWMLYNQAER